MASRRLPLSLALLSLAAGAWTCRQRTEADFVLEAVAEAGRAAENRDLGAFMAVIDDAYSDFEGRDKAGLEALIAGYFAGRTGIVVHRLGAKLSFPEPARAGLETDVALSSGPAEAVRRLVKISPDLYRLNLELVRPAGRWLVRHAEWRSVGVTEVLPESLRPLRGLLPISNRSEKP